METTELDVLAAERGLVVWDDPEHGLWLSDRIGRVVWDEPGGEAAARVFLREAFDDAADEARDAVHRLDYANWEAEHGDD